MGIREMIAVREQQTVVLNKMILFSVLLRVLTGPWDALETALSVGQATV